jgi:hypothetical protein
MDAPLREMWSKPAAIATAGAASGLPGIIRQVLVEQVEESEPGAGGTFACRVTLKAVWF